MALTEYGRWMAQQNAARARAAGSGTRRRDTPEWQLANRQFQQGWVDKRYQEQLARAQGAYAGALGDPTAGGRVGPADNGFGPRSLANLGLGLMSLAGPIGGIVGGLGKLGMDWMDQRRREDDMLSYRRAREVAAERLRRARENADTWRASTMAKYGLSGDIGGSNGL